MSYASKKAGQNEAAFIVAVLIIAAAIYAALAIAGYWL